MSKETLEIIQGYLKPQRMLMTAVTWRTMLLTDKPAKLVLTENKGCPIKRQAS